MEYRIIKAAAETGQIEVMYTHEGRDIAAYMIDVPIIEGRFLTGADLDAEIRHRAPTWLVEREQAIKTAVGFDEIVKLVVPPEAHIDTQVQQQLAQQRFEQEVASILVKFGVLPSNPTTIEVTKL